MSYDNIDDYLRDTQKRHDVYNVYQDIYTTYAYDAYPHNSKDEIDKSYRFLSERMESSADYQKSIFQIITDLADKMLIYDGAQIRCKFDELLRWRDVSFQLGQDFFTCAYLAKHDIEHGMWDRKYFAWSSMIPSDNDRITNILDKGIAENHFHLGGSTKIFELNWACVMNFIEDRASDFKQIEKAMQLKIIDPIQDKHLHETLYQRCQKAALYRIYLFSVLKENKDLEDETKKIINAVDNYNIDINLKVSEIQSIIDIIKYEYAGKMGGHILDYAYEMNMVRQNDNECRLLAGERHFLYECYKNSLGDEFTYHQKNIFYKYLLLRTDFRNELIQVNRQVGFFNFSDYQDRKKYFIKDKKAYGDELTRLALNETIQRKRMKSFENRIGPENSAYEFNDIVKYYQRIAKETDTTRQVNSEDVSYVISFPKTIEKKRIQYEARNFELRNTIKYQSQYLADMLLGEYPYKRYIKGIDACSHEMACRPEAFGQVFRFLTDIEYTYSDEEVIVKRNDDRIYKSDKRNDYKIIRSDEHNIYKIFKSDDQDNVDIYNREKIVQKYRGKRLNVTYHAGEDFLDIVDGVRAIDEAMLFCNMKRGSRIGHALALGISPEKYYAYKNNVLLLPKQILMDDIAWLICRSDELGCVMDVGLKTSLMETFVDLYKDVYDKYMPREMGDITIYEYFQSWKLRGDNPDLYKELDNKKFNDYIKRKVKLRFDRYELNDKIPKSIRETEKYRWLYYNYHFTEKVRTEGDKIFEFKVDNRYAKAVRNVQDGMIRELVNKGIGIETNPSSNYLIGTIERYDEHPIIRFNSRKLKKAQDNNMSLSVSINTDDQGVFDTSLENEYALMTLALKKAKDENNNPLYDIEDIYEWIDYVREMGIEQVFR
jgi:hypothetical protein